MTNIVLRVSIINHNYRRLPHTGPPRNHSSDLTASPQCSIVSSHCQLAGAPVSSGRWLLSRVSFVRRATAREFDRRRVSALRTLLLIPAAATAAVTLLIVALLILLQRRPSRSVAGESTRRQRHWVLRADASRTLRRHVKLGNLQYTFNAPFKR